MTMPARGMVGSTHFCGSASWSTGLYISLLVIACSRPRRPTIAIRGIAAATESTCVLLADGSVRCWGSNEHRMLCPNEQQYIRTPTAHERFRGVRSLFGGMSGYCGEFVSGRLQCWGLIPGGHEGRFDDSATVSVRRSFELGSGVRVAMGLEHICTVDTRGRVQCWGLGQYGELGIPGPAPSPVMVSLPGTAVEVAATANDTCVLLSNGEMHCSGLSAHARTFHRHRSGIRRLIPGFSNICFVGTRGDVDCLVPDGMVQHLRQTAGWNAARGDSLVLAGSFGCIIGPTRQRLICSVSRPEPPQLLGGVAATTWETRSIPLQHPVRFGTAGVLHACFVDASNAVFCVGSNLFGQLARTGVGSEWSVRPIEFGASRCPRGT